jgi:hypothetical protein
MILMHPDEHIAVHAGPAGVVKLRVISRMNRWSYSTPTDQFGAKPYSRPTPTVPPQRVCGERREDDGDDDSSPHHGHAPAHRSSALKKRWRTLTSANSALNIRESIARRLAPRRSPSPVG